MGIFSKRPTTLQSDPARDFDPNSDKYKCCCRSMHVTTGAKLVAICYILAVTIHLIAGSINYAKLGDVYAGWFSKSVANFVLCIIAVVFLLYAIRTQKRMFIIPLLAYQAIFAIIMIIIIVLLSKALAMSGKQLWVLSHTVGQPHPSDDTRDIEAKESKLMVTSVLAIILLLVTIFALAMNVRYFFVIYLTFKYYRDKSLYESVHQGPPVGTQVKYPTAAIIVFDDGNPYERKQSSHEISV